MILIVNGVNTKKGGAGTDLLATWIRSLDSRGKMYYVLDTVYTDSRLNGLLNKCLQALYFMPGTLLRVSRFPLFELAYKISPWVFWKCIRVVRQCKPKNIIFSHHAVFYTAYMFNREKTHYIIHDLLYRRSRSLGFGRRLSKFIFWVELRMYRRPVSLFCVSYQEERILRHFGFKRIQLLSAYPIDTEICHPEHYDFPCLAIVSDWRRPENGHGLKTFFQQPISHGKVDVNVEIRCAIYGYASEMIGKVQSENFSEHMKLKVEAKGFYKDYAAIPEGLFLVPIYHGAGIKIKLLHALRHRRYVLGTPAAFAGLPRYWLRGVSKIVHSIEDVARVSIDIDPQAFFRFEERYNERFVELGDVDFNTDRGFRACDISARL